jgi:hypothetical protein
MTRNEWHFMVNTVRDNFVWSMATEITFKEIKQRLAGLGGGTFELCLIEDVQHDLLI